jgi:hypothetical protein
MRPCGGLEGLGGCPRGPPEGRPRAIHDEPLRGPGDDGGEGGLCQGGEAALGSLISPTQDFALKAS